MNKLRIVWWWGIMVCLLASCSTPAPNRHICRYSCSPGVGLSHSINPVNVL